jgi:hypothetical protein
MKVQIRRFGILQMGKVLALIYGFFAVTLFPIFLIATIANPGEGFPMLIMIVLYPLMGFIGGIIGAAVYNLASKLIGGIKVELDVEGNIQSEINV